MLKRLGSLLLLLLLLNKAESQLSFLKGTFGYKRTIEFDTSGKMISYPGTFITPGTKLKFKVYTSGNAYMPWIRLLFANLEKANEHIQKAEVQSQYNCLFGNNISYKVFISSAATRFNLVDSCSVDGLKMSLMATNNTPVVSKVDIAVVPKIDTTVVPINLLLKNIDNQYSVKIYKNDICIQTVPLTKEKNCGKDCGVFTADIQIKKIKCKECVASPTDQFRFELVYTNPWDETIRQWHKKIAAKIENSDLENIRLGLNDIEQNNVGRLDKLNALKTWMVKWFWLTGGVISIDPFNVPTKSWKENINSNIDSLSSDITFLQEKIIFLDSTKKSVKKSLYEIKLLDSIQKEQRKFSEELATAKKQKSKFQTQLEPSPLLVRLNSNVMIYQGRMELSKGGLAIAKRGIYPHMQFDAYKGFQPVKMNYFQRRKLTEIPENEQMYMAVHNIPKNVAIKLDEKRLNFDDQEEFTALLSEQLSKIDFSSLGVPLVRNVEDFFKSLRDPETEKKLFSGGAMLDTVNEQECVSVIKDLVKEFRQKTSSGIITFPPDPKLFDQITISGPAFRTHLAPITEFEAPFRDSITIKAIYAKDSVVDVAKTFVKVGKLRFFQLMAGVAVMKNPVPITKIDTVGGGFRVSSSDNAAKAIFGFKIYPFKNYNRDHSILPRYPLRRFSFFAGAELLHPLDNFYLGGAYDIIPGLAFSIGTNINLQTTYQVQNNAIVNTSRKYQQSSTYYAVSVNPVLFVQFVKLFFK